MPAIDEAGGQEATAGPAAADHLILTTIGIDVGSSTSHLAFARIELARMGDHLSSRMVPVRRTLLARSPILLTPYLPDFTIDAEAVRRFVDAAFAEAGLQPEDIDTGAVVLTGEAVKRRNARSITERLARSAGSLVATSAGPRLEAVLAAHGSGCVARSRTMPGQTLLNIDIGGGTTKLALVRDGRILRMGALSIGARLVAVNRRDDRIERIEPAGSWFAERIGVQLRLGDQLLGRFRGLMGDVMADTLLEVILGGGIHEELSPLWVTDPMPIPTVPDYIMFSGGVAGYVAGTEPDDFGDLGRVLGEGVRQRLEARWLWKRVLPAVETIRATVLGLSQYTTQVSGNTIFLPDVLALPLRDFVVVKPELPVGLEEEAAARLASDLTARRREQAEFDEHRLAVALSWRGVPFHADLCLLAQALLRGHEAAPADSPLVLLLDSDVGRSVGRIVRDELGWEGPLVCLDGIDVEDGDVVDIGGPVGQAGAVPVVVKSLVFPGPDEPAEQHQLALSPER